MQNRLVSTYVSCVSYKTIRRLSKKRFVFLSVLSLNDYSRKTLKNYVFNGAIGTNCEDFNQFFEKYRFFNGRHAALDIWTRSECINFPFELLVME